MVLLNHLREIILEINLRRGLRGNEKFFKIFFRKKVGNEMDLCGGREMSEQYDPQLVRDVLEQGESGLEEITSEDGVTCSKKWKCKIYLSGRKYCPKNQEACLYYGRIVGD